MEKVNRSHLGYFFMKKNQLNFQKNRTGETLIMTILLFFPYPAHVNSKAPN